MNKSESIARADFRRRFAGSKLGHPARDSFYAKVIAKYSATEEFRGSYPSNPVTVDDEIVPMLKAYVDGMKTEIDAWRKEFPDFEYLLYQTDFSPLVVRKLNFVSHPELENFDFPCAVSFEECEGALHFKGATFRGLNFDFVVPRSTESTFYDCTFRGNSAEPLEAMPKTPKYRFRGGEVSFTKCVLQPSEIELQAALLRWQGGSFNAEIIGGECRTELNFLPVLGKGNDAKTGKPKIATKPQVTILAFNQALYEPILIEHGESVHLDLKSCNIRHNLILRNSAMTYFDLIGAQIHQGIELSNVTYPPRRKLLEQSFRSLKLVFEQQDDPDLTMLFRAYEYECRHLRLIKAEKKNRSEIWISRLYWLINKWGSAPLQPLAGIVLLWGLFSALYISLDGAYLLDHEKAMLAAHPLQEVLLATKGTIGPFGILLFDRLHPANEFVFLLLIFQMLLCTTLWYFLIFGVRKKYKLDS